MQHIIIGKLQTCYQTPRLLQNIASEYLSYDIPVLYIPDCHGIAACIAIQGITISV